MFYLYHQCQSCHSFKYFEQHIVIFWKKYQHFHTPGIDTDPDGSDPDRHALDADLDQDSAK
jgi:hypothetical protein